jgi:hypothetical protein
MPVGAHMDHIAVDKEKLSKFLVLVQSANRASSDNYQMIELAAYFRRQLKTGGQVSTASAMGRKGGLSRSESKVTAAKRNAQRAGRRGQYFAALTFPDTEKSITYVFSNKRVRDEWVARNEQYRKGVYTIESRLRARRQQDPASIAKGDLVLERELQVNRDLTQFERDSNTCEECDGCADLMELCDSRRIGPHLLCKSCVEMIR